MKIGTVLHIELNNPKTKKNDKYRCKVIEINEHSLIIDYPINEITNKTAFYQKEDILVCPISGTMKLYINLRVI
ncbi:hypothetical protein CV093_11255 [Oceanobacillus sp. 143]|nr:hypothetical protein CV093_11255 [Oceanobacillus sp. 143]